MRVSATARLFRFLSDVLLRGFYGAVALHEGFWLGVLRDHTLQEITSASYDASKLYASAEHNSKGLFTWEKESIDRFFPSRGRVLIAAAGAGREAVGMLQRGFEVTAFDSSRELIETFRARLAPEYNGRIDVLHAAPDTVPDGIQTDFDCAIMGWGAITHMTSAALRDGFLRQIAACMKPGAPILISFHYRPEPSRSDSMRYVLARTMSALTFGRQVSAGDYFRLELHLPMFLHLFRREEIEASLANSGLVLMHYTEAPPQAHCVAIKRLS
jgi:SAM-dependent methyltransferase